MATNPDVQALLAAVDAVAQEVTDLEGKVNSGTALSSGDFAAIRQATQELTTLAGGTAPAPVSSGGSNAPPSAGVDNPAPDAAPQGSDTAPPEAPNPTKF